MLLPYVVLVVNAFLRKTGGVRRYIAVSHQGQSMVEYAILAALIAIVAMAAVQALGGGISTVFQNILGRLSGLGGGGR
jgi:Flp pilus assembly pilin Flp